jgi:ribosomal protein S19
MRFISFIVRRAMVGKKLGEFSMPKVMGSKVALSKYLKLKKKKKKK